MDQRGVSLGNNSHAISILFTVWNYEYPVFGILENGGCIIRTVRLYLKRFGKVQRGLEYCTKFHRDVFNF